METYQDVIRGEGELAERQRSEANNNKLDRGLNRSRQQRTTRFVLCGRLPTSSLFEMEAARAASKAWLLSGGSLFRQLHE